MKDYILYVLPFKNGKHFKFGITKVKNFTRIKMIHKMYEIDMEKCYIYRSDRDSIMLIENKLKEYELLQVEEYRGLEGYTEIRNISELQNSIDIIESYTEFDLIKEPLTMYNREFRFSMNRVEFKPNVLTTLSSLKTGGEELPNLDLTSSDISDIEVPYESTLRSGLFR
jgi:hypothetical protein